MTVTLTDNNLYVCPDWCDNHYTRRPHSTEVVTHRQSIRSGSAWRVDVLAAPGGDPIIWTEGPEDGWTCPDDAAQFAAAVMQAALVLAKEGVCSQVCTP